MYISSVKTAAGLLIDFGRQVSHWKSIYSKIKNGWKYGAPSVNSRIRAFSGSFIVKSTLAVAGKTVTVTTQSDVWYGVERVSITTLNGRQIPREADLREHHIHLRDAPQRGAGPGDLPARGPLGESLRKRAESTWYYDAVQYVSENRLMGGPPDRFHPDITIPQGGATEE